VGAGFRAAAAASRIAPSLAVAMAVAWAGGCARCMAGRLRKAAGRMAGLRNLLVCAAGFAATPAGEMALSSWALAGGTARRRTRTAPKARIGTPARQNFFNANLAEGRIFANAHLVHATEVESDGGPDIAKPSHFRE
jgi:hypothetical protein